MATRGNRRPRRHAPVLSMDEYRGKLVTFDFTPEELAVVAGAAQRCGMPIQEWTDWAIAALIDEEIQRRRRPGRRKR